MTREQREAELKRAKRNDMILGVFGWFWIGFCIYYVFFAD